MRATLLILQQTLPSRLSTPSSPLGSTKFCSCLEKYDRRILPEKLCLDLHTDIHEQDVPAEEARPGVTWVKTSYQDANELTEILKGAHTVFSFVVTQSDPGNVAQRNLIDASIRAGVKRFAPSEWAT